VAVGAIIAAAGRSERMGGVDKMLVRLAGRPLIAHSVAAFAGSRVIDRVVVVVSEANREAIAALLGEIAPAVTMVPGGERRRDSVLNGLEALAGCEHVVVHDGARPLVTAELIERALQGARKEGAAICAVPIADTVKRVDDKGFVSGTVSRGGLWLAQTPQAFHAGLLMMGHESTELDVTDDAALLELMGAPVSVVQGSPRNLKVTTPEDLRLAEALLAARS
jgi:2-C-methyl-D-erythritol 4-phosphate cytidylyltransferase